MNSVENLENADEVSGLTKQHLAEVMNDGSISSTIVGLYNHSESIGQFLKMSKSLDTPIPEDQAILLWNCLGKLKFICDVYSSNTSVSEPDSKELRGVETYRIHHRADIGDCSIYIESKDNPTEAAVYLQLKGEDLSDDDEICLSNLAIANALVSLYGCSSGIKTNNAIDIDMHDERESRACTWYRKNRYWVGPKDILRTDEELLTVLKPHFGDQ
jgi:hypothetical protein